jgi:hypothetical protein
LVALFWSWHMVKFRTGHSGEGGGHFSLASIQNASKAGAREIQRP